MGRTRRTRGAGGAKCPLRGPSPGSRGDLSAGLRRSAHGWTRRAKARSDHRHGRPQHAHLGPLPASHRPDLQAAAGRPVPQLLGVRNHALRHVQPEPGDSAHHRPRAGLHAAGQDHRLRRQPHLHTRSVRRVCHRYWHHTGRARAGDSVHRAAPVQDHGGPSRGGPSHGGDRQGPDTRRDRQDRHRRGRGTRGRVHRRGHPLSLDGGPHDGVQHVH